MEYTPFDGREDSRAECLLGGKGWPDWLGCKRARGEFKATGSMWTEDLKNSFLIHIMYRFVFLFNVI